MYFVLHTIRTCNLLPRKGRRKFRRSSPVLGTPSFSAAIVGAPPHRIVASLHHCAIVRPHLVLPRMWTCARPPILAHPPSTPSSVHPLLLDWPGPPSQTFDGAISIWVLDPPPFPQNLPTLPFMSALSLAPLPSLFSSLFPYSLLYERTPIPSSPRFSDPNPSFGDRWKLSPS
jgi:hypothetical protein